MPVTETSGFMLFFRGKFSFNLIIQTGKAIKCIKVAFLKQESSSELPFLSPNSVLFYFSDYCLILLCKEIWKLCCQKKKAEIILDPLIIKFKEVESVALQLYDGLGCK